MPMRHPEKPMKTPELPTIDEVRVHFTPAGRRQFLQAISYIQRDRPTTARLPVEVEEAEPLDEEYAPAEGDEEVPDDFAAESILEKAGA